MKCPKCGRKLKKGVSQCPSCSGDDLFSFSPFSQSSTSNSSTTGFDDNLFSSSAQSSSPFPSADPFLSSAPTAFDIGGTQHTSSNNQSKNKSKKRILIAFAAVAVVIIVAVITMLLGESSSPAVQTTFSNSSTQVAVNTTDSSNFVNSSSQNAVNQTTNSTSEAQSVSNSSDRLPNLSAEYDDHIFLDGRSVKDCYSLTGDVALTVVFVNDDKSKWSSNDINECKQNLITETQKIINDASSYGAQLDISLNYLTAKASDIADRDNMTPWVSEALKSVGFSDATTVESDLKNTYNTKEAPVIFIVNYDDRSFATSINSFEFSLVYGKDVESYRHELFHMFGAIDYYYPTDLYTIANQYYPDSIMMGTTDEAMIDELNAYLIGWTDSISSQALDILDKTKHITQEIIDAEHEHETYTGYVKNYRSQDTVYTGNLINGFRDGYGVLKYDDGNSYEGEFKNNNRNGQGTFTWANGNSYEGDWVDGEKHGNGTFTYYNGDKYVGPWVNGNQHGVGVFTWADGNKYEGDWVDGERHGNGTLYFADGSTYIGDFFNGERTGQGTYTWANGDSFTGEWVDGNRQGNGVYTYADGSQKSGQWKNDEFIG